MKLLPAPYGFQTYGSVLIEFTRDASQPMDDHAVRAALVAHSCWPPVIQKVLDCLRHAGHYECCMRAAVAKEIDRGTAMRAAGVRFRLR